MATETVGRTKTPHLAEVIEVQRCGSHFSVTIDGDEFPWYIAENGIKLGVTQGEMPTVTLTIVADDVRVLNKIADD